MSHKCHTNVTGFSRIFRCTLDCLSILSFLRPKRAPALKNSRNWAIYCNSWANIIIDFYLYGYVSDSLPVRINWSQWSSFEHCVTFKWDCDDSKSNSWLTADRNSRSEDGAITLTLRIENYNKCYTFSRDLLLYLVNWRGRLVFSVNYFHFIFVGRRASGLHVSRFEFSAPGSSLKDLKDNSRPFEVRYSSVSPRFWLKMRLYT